MKKPNKILSVNFDEKTMTYYKNRPISPHVTVFKLGWTGTLSILHRITGILLSLYLVVAIFFVKVVSYHLSDYRVYEIAYQIDKMQGIYFTLFTLLLSMAFFFHLLTGTRHLIWDTGQWFDVERVVKSSQWIVALSVGLGTFFWLIV